MLMFMIAAACGMPLLKADVVPPPRRLNRIGYEVMPSTNKVTRKTSEPKGARIVDLLKQFVSARKSGNTNEAESIAGELGKFDRRQIAEAYRILYSDVEGRGWKFATEVSLDEKALIRAKITDVRPRLQQACDVKYPILLAEKKLKYINRNSGYDRPYRYERYCREVRTENCRLTVLAVLEEHPELRSSCSGIPIEWLVDAVNVPEPSLSIESVKATFRSWAIRNMKGLSQLEREILFRWQFFCCEAEKRPWYTEFSKESLRARGDKRFIGEDGFRNRFSDFGMSGWERGRQQEVESHAGFEDLRIDTTNVADTVVAWYRKSVGLGLQPRAFDTYLIEKATKRPGELGRLHVTVRHDSVANWSGYAYGQSGNLSSTEVEIRCGADKDEIQMAHDYCAYLVEGKGYVDDVRGLTFFSLDGETMKTACKAFAHMKLHELKISGEARVQRWPAKGQEGPVKRQEWLDVDVSALAGFSDLQDISFHGCRVQGDAQFSRFKSLSHFHAVVCQFETLSFLENCAKVKWPAFRDCSFDSAQSLGTFKNVEQLFLKGTRGVLDLAFLEGLSSLEQLHIEGCVVTNAAIVKNLPKLKYLDVTGAKGDCNWDEIVLACPNLGAKGVEETIHDANRRKLYAREMRHRGNKRMPLDFQLRDAVAANDISDVKALLEKGASAQSVWRRMPNKWGNTSVEIVKMLLNNGAELSAPDTRDVKEIRRDGTIKIRPAEARGRGMDELWHLCCADESETNRVSLVRLLLERGCDPNGLTFSGKSALSALLEKHKPNGDDVEMLRILFEHGANAKNIDDYLRSHLVSSLEDRRFGIPMLYLLLKHGLEIDVSEMDLGRALRNTAVVDGNLDEALKFIVKKGVDVNRSGRFDETPLARVMQDRERRKEERLGLAKLLLECGADPNRQSKSDSFGKLPLQIVLESGRYEMEERLAMAELLLKHGADPNRMSGHAPFRKPLMLEASETKGCEKILELMIKHGGVFRPQDFSLHEKFRFADFGDTNAVASLKFYLDKGADPNERGFHGESFLSVVVGRLNRRRKGEKPEESSAMAVRLLLDRGADVNAKDTFGRTALSEAVEGGDVAVVRLLLDRGAKLGEGDTDGRVVERAARSRNDASKAALLKLLIERGLGPITDQAIAFAWWNKEARDYLLAKSGKSADGFDVIDTGELKSVRVKQPNAKEAYVKEMKRRESMWKRQEEFEKMRMERMRPRGFPVHDDGMRRREEEAKKRRREYEKRLDEAWLEYYSRQKEAQSNKEAK